MSKVKHFKKHHVIILSVCVMLLASISIGTGFLISKPDGAINKLSVGSNESHIEETFSSYDSFTKGQNYEKKVAVKNDGDVSCYVRAFAEIEEPKIAANVGINFNTVEWTVKQPDGYYYYKNKLKPGEKTVPLFTTLTAKADITEFQMICYSETVQADGASNSIAAFNN